MQNKNNRQQQQQQEQQKTLRRTHFYNSKTEVSPCRAASSCLFIRVFGSCIVLLAMQGRQRERERKGGVCCGMPLPAHWVACRESARAWTFCHIFWPGTFVKDAKSFCVAFSAAAVCRLFCCCCCCLRSTWNHKCSRCRRCCRRCCWWRLTRPEVVQNLKRKSIVREQAQWPPLPEPEPEAAAAALPSDAIFGHNDITRSHTHTHRHASSHTRHTRYAFFVVFYWVIGAFICHTPHARFMPAMCHVAKTNSRLSVPLSRCPSVQLSLCPFVLPASQPVSQSASPQAAQNCLKAQTSLRPKYVPHIFSLSLSHFPCLLRSLSVCSSLSFFDMRFPFCNDLIVA